MILRPHRPSSEEVRALLRARTESTVTYPGASPTASYCLDHYARDLGNGRALYERACAALRDWQMFSMPGVELHRTDLPIAVGQAVAVVARLGFCWSVNPSRIIGLLADTDSVRRFGFRYATLPGHAIQGEECFSVSWSAETDRVRYEIVARSRPAAWLLRIPVLARPWVRLVQRRFGAGSLLAMQRAVDAHPDPARGN